jgi:hypothetical protein
MTNTITGGCLCGKVRYSFSTAPIFTGNCHCRDCQKASGGPYTPAMFVAEPSVELTGEVKYFESKADSGRLVARGFCPNCGSQLFSKLEMLPNVLGIRAGTLDDPNNFEPKMDIFTDSAADWDTMNPALPKFEKSPR